MSVDVKCSVSNCYFWHDSNLCGAPAIMVTVDEQAQSRFSEEIAGEVEVDLKRTDAANTPGNTCCHTFRPH